LLERVGGTLLSHFSHMDSLFHFKYSSVMLKTGFSCKRNNSL
jgi:hypothetical protein